jgi:hypothetical protein
VVDEERIATDRSDVKICYGCHSTFLDGLSAFENAWCESCHTAGNLRMTAVEDICMWLDSEGPYTARTWLRTAARWQAELGGTFRQFELGLFRAALGLAGRRIKGFKGETRRIVLECLNRVVHSEAVAAWAGENEINRLAAMDAAS